mmetsp:Transcript_16239/g.24461  ORF Transcript_16239/g.24461 Transcript_16239/m.24461 type:complete len:502 (+) Transcript_16239:171-1676(+)
MSSPWAGVKLRKVDDKGTSSHSPQSFNNTNGSFSNSTLSGASPAGSVNSDTDSVKPSAYSSPSSTSYPSAIGATSPAKPAKPHKPPKTVSVSTGENTSNSSPLADRYGLSSKYKNLTPAGPQATQPTGFSSSPQPSVSPSQSVRISHTKPPCPAPPIPLPSRPAPNTASAVPPPPPPRAPAPPSLKTVPAVPVDSMMKPQRSELSHDGDSNISAKKADKSVSLSIPFSSRKLSLQGSMSQLSSLFASNCTLHDLQIYPNSTDAERLQGSQRLTELNGVLSSASEESESERETPLGTSALIREGFLDKCNRDGMQRFYCVLTEECFAYCRVVGAMGIGGNRIKLNRVIPLTSLLVREANSDFASARGMLSTDSTEADKSKTFLLLSTQKSFHLTAASESAKHSWMEAITVAARNSQQKAGTTPSVDNMCPVWKLDSSAPCCELCKAEFSVLFRRHHCRNCGKCTCENCSRDKCRIPRIDPRELFRVCTECAPGLKAARNYAR